MKQRVISSLVGLCLLGGVLLIIDTPVFNLFVAALSIIALYEMLRAIGCLKNRGLAALSFLLALGISFAGTLVAREWAVPSISLFFVAFFALLVKYSSETSVEQMAMAFMFSVFIPLFFTCCVFMRDMFGAGAGGFYLLMACGSAWWCDTGAYFTGRRFGKTKLAPVVSPNKTVEGAVGGLVCAVVFNQLIALLCELVLLRMGYGVSVKYALLAAFTPFWAVMGMLGDLSASVVKRQFNVKDYGSIMPGHGGVLDRFDSVLFTLPAVFLIANHASVIAVV
jgi:phosphatidate cytidylyltransferase